MSQHDPHSIYDPNSPYYDDAPRYPKASGGIAFGLICIGGFLVAFFWSYVAPVYYTIAYMVDFLAHLGAPRAVVKWQGDSSTYAVGVAGLTIVALTGGVVWLIHSI